MIDFSLGDVLHHHLQVYRLSAVAGHYSTVIANFRVPSTASFPVGMPCTSSFNPETDIADLSGKVILVTGGQHPTALSTIKPNESSQATQA